MSNIPMNENVNQQQKCKRCGGRGVLAQIGYNMPDVPCPMCGGTQQEPNATGGVDLAVLRGQVLLLKTENEQLRARVEQLEAALMAVALNRPVGCDDNGRLKALPLDNPPLSNGPPCHPGAFWKAEETTGGNVAVCSVCGGRGGY